MMSRESCSIPDSALIQSNLLRLNGSGFPRCGESSKNPKESSRRQSFALQAANNPGGIPEESLPVHPPKRSSTSKRYNWWEIGPWASADPSRISKESPSILKAATWFQFDLSSREKWSYLVLSYQFPRLLPGSGSHKKKIQAGFKFNLNPSERSTKPLEQIESTKPVRIDSVAEVSNIFQRIRRLQSELNVTRTDPRRWNAGSSFDSNCPENIGAFVLEHDRSNPFPRVDWMRLTIQTVGKWQISLH